MLSKADFALLFFFVLYLKKINNGMAFSSESGPALEAGAVFRWHALLGPVDTGLACMLWKYQQNEIGLGSFH